MKYCAYVNLLILLINNGTCWRIIGGRPAKLGEFPYQVSLRKSYNGDHFCGGAIITSMHIITAAHCMYYRWGGVLPPIVVTVIAGQLDLPITNTTVSRNVKTITPHEDFSLVTFANDIAILTLDKELPLDLNPLLAKIALRQDAILFGSCLVSGWGVEEEDTDEISEVLLVAKVNIVNFETCKQMYAELMFELPDGSLCAGDNGTQDACQGDSGGPLVCDGLLTGIVSTGNGCGNLSYPGIYTSIEVFLPWIEDKLQLNTINTNDSNEVPEENITSPSPVKRNNSEFINLTQRPLAAKTSPSLNSNSVNLNRNLFVIVLSVFLMKWW